MANKLILTLDGEVIKEFKMDVNESASIGRKHENNIQLNDLTVSGMHALVTTKNNTANIEDLGSTNGTLVNGNHVVQSQLQHGNVIQIGHHLLTFMNDDKESYEPTMFVRAELDETQMVLPEWEMNENAVQMRGRPLAALKKLNDPMSNSGIELRKNFSTLGFQGKTLAMISRGNSGYTIATIGGVNSRRSTDIPLLNGEPLRPKPDNLSEGDIVSIAGIEMKFYFIN